MSAARFIRSLFALVLPLLAPSAVCRAQEGVVRLAAGKVSVGELISETEKQTRYLFVYGSDVFDTEREVEVNCAESGITEILDMITRDSWRYEIRNRYIILSLAPQPPKKNTPQIKYAVPPGFDEPAPEKQKGREFPTEVIPQERKKNNIRPVITPGV